MDSVNRHFSKEEKRKPDTSPGDLGEFVDDLPDTGFANALLNALLKQFLANSKAALRGEAVLKFKSKEKMEEFLASNFPDGFKILGKSDALNAVRVGYDKAQSLWRSLVDSGVREGDLDIAPNFLVTYPSVPSPSTPVTEIAPQPDAQGFGYNLLDWLGVSEGQNANWGAGMKVAVIDGMIQSHETFREGQIKTTSLLDPDTPVDPNDGHATAVTSIYAGNTREAPGLTPLVEIDGYQVLDSTGNGDSFTLAEAIIQAVNNRADLINVSLGSYGNSQVVADAVAYAEQAGVPIVAAAGNDGTEGITFPAGYDYVIAVASIEAEGERMNFSNSGEQLDISAPGLEIPAAWPEGVVGFSGTSASAPVVGAAIASVGAAICATVLVLKSRDALHETQQREPT